jgi:hypothetical protein
MNSKRAVLVLLLALDPLDDEDEDDSQKPK